MEWQRLIDDTRLGVESDRGTRPGLRSDFTRDYDRLVFSSPFRRLQNKTQVFPLPGSIFVHNRLTHSLEVACVGRSLAAMVACGLHAKYAGEPWVRKLDSLGEITAAACLAHDLGNPPFGHSGEKAIATFFSEGPGRRFAERLTPLQWADLTRFEGNANTFRLLTHPFAGRRPGGFAMTYSTLAGIVKYPWQSTLADKVGTAEPKFGFFSTERDTFVHVAERLGMRRLPAPDDALRYARHPLVYLVEAADDICYEVMDIEDAHKLGLLTTDTVVEHLIAFFRADEQQRLQALLAGISDPNERVSHMRSVVIDTLVHACADIFIACEEQILAGELTGTLIDRLPEPLLSAFRRCEALSWERIYTAPDVIDIELAGNRIISFLMEALTTALDNPDLNYSRLLLAKVPQQYRVDSPTLFGRLQAAVDHVSGMTDVYALDLYRKLNAMSLKINN